MPRTREQSTSHTATPLDEPYMTINEVAALLRVSYWTVYRLIQNREITGVRIGRSHRIVPNSVAAYRARLLQEVA